ncbi:hypothetical protein [Allomuricauda sp. F6463D]|uniref:hypothetical protein n=1 Tax=Allomuricauda sp. F6463D TaxID=2926409 RepID=UPI001FF3C874|nr:hypothetical protein [Muricauda sp. F6463D]MCK0160647.1 hypothetical protein [Muricauda sp. F6463D]
MKSKVLYILFFAMIMSGAVNAQLNNYKYIIVPKKFDAFNAENKYQSSTLLKYYFAENGFDVVYDDAFPVDLAGDRCLGLVADIIDDSSMFTTKVNIALRDCNNVEVFRSVEGRSKIKEYNESYKQALKNAFVSYTGMNHEYEPRKEDVAKETAPVTISFKDDVKSVEKESKEHVIEQKATMEEQVYKAVEPKRTTIAKTVGEDKIDASNLTGVLYAQPIENGYQLVDSTPKVVLKLEETSMENIYITDFQGNNAVVFQQKGTWMLEYSENGNKVQKELNIKF